MPAGAAGLTSMPGKPPPRRERPHPVAAFVVRGHQAVDVARQLGAAPLVRRLELRRDVGALRAAERDEASAEAELLAAVARERGGEVVAMGDERIGERGGIEGGLGDAGAD